jgi:hypothetical protein
LLFLFLAVLNLAIRTSHGQVALCDKLGLLLTSLARLGLFENLAAGRPTATRRLELAHVFPVALDLFLLGVGPRGKQGPGASWLGTRGSSSSSNSPARAVSDKGGRERLWRE